MTENTKWREGATPNEVICTVRLHNPADFSGEERPMPDTDKLTALERSIRAAGKCPYNHPENTRCPACQDALPRPTPLEDRCPTCGEKTSEEITVCSDGFHADGPTYWPLEDRDKLIERLQAEVLRLVDALAFAHSEGFEWPVDPLPFGSIAHDLFIKRGNDPERIARKALDDGGEK
jgi:hypothetical protein